MVPARKSERRMVTVAATRKTRTIAEPLAVDDRVDVAALGRQEQRAVDGAVALDGHRYRDDQLAAVGDPHDRSSGTPSSASLTSG